MCSAPFSYISFSLALLLLVVVVVVLLVRFHLLLLPWSAIFRWRKYCYHFRFVFLFSLAMFYFFGSLAHARERVTFIYLFMYKLFLCLDLNTWCIGILSKWNAISLLFIPNRFYPQPQWMCVCVFLASLMHHVYFSTSICYFCQFIWHVIRMCRVNAYRIWVGGAQQEHAGVRGMKRGSRSGWEIEKRAKIIKNDFRSV